jgi:hypothetical protein
METIFDNLSPSDQEHVAAAIAKERCAAIYQRNGLFSMALVAQMEAEEHYAMVGVK